MMGSRYQNIVVGASFYGCGLAAALPGSSLVIEPSILVGSDFTLTFNPGLFWEEPAVHPWAKAFRDELTKRNALKGDRIHQPALCPVFSRWCLDHALEVSLGTCPLAVGDHKVEIMDCEGRHTLQADRVLSAMPVPGSVKRLTASLQTGDGSVEGRYGGFEIISGRFYKEAFLLMDLEESVSWPEARARLFILWQARSDALKDCRILTVANHFDYNNFPNPVTALDHGLRGVV